MEKGPGSATFVDLESALTEMESLVGPALQELERIEKDLEDWPSLNDSRTMEFWSTRHASLDAELDRIEQVLLDYGYEAFSKEGNGAEEEDNNVVVGIDGKDCERDGEETTGDPEDLVQEEKVPDEKDYIFADDEEDVDITLESLGLSMQSMALLSASSFNTKHTAPATATQEECAKELEQYLSESSRQSIAPLTESEYGSLDVLVTDKFSFEV